MVQIIQKTPTFGEALGTGLGSGLGKGLQRLSELHMQDIFDKKQRSQVAKGLEPILKNKRAAEVLSNLPPEMLKLAIQNPAILMEILKEEQQGSTPELFGQAAGQGGGLLEGLGQIGGPQQGQGPTQEQLQYLERLSNPLGNRQPQQPIFGRQPGQPEQIEQALTQQAQQARQPIAPQQSQENSQQRAQNIAELFTSPQERREREKLNLQKIQTYQPKFEKIEQEAKSAREIKDTAEKALGLVKARFAKTGLVGAFTPKYLQTPEGQVLGTYLQQLVLKNAQHGKGLPSVARLKLEEGAKAAIWQNPKAIERILEDTINNPEIVKEVSRGNSLDQLQDKYGGNIPDDIFAQLNRETSKSIKSHAQEQSSKALKDVQSKYPASKQDEGDIATNPNTGEDEFIVRNGQWERL
jgi:hypothetical protein